jgi:hypothetical protein
MLSGEPLTRAALPEPAPEGTPVREWFPQTHYIPRSGTWQPAVESAP